MGTQYRSAIFFHDFAHKAQAERAVEDARSKLGTHKKIVTELKLAMKWHPAEDYHQQYLEKDGQDATKGSTKPIQCYGNRGPIKNLEELSSRDGMNLLKGTKS